MSREKFFNALGYFDKNFNDIVNNDKEWDKLMQEHKWFYDKEMSAKHSQSHNHINLTKVRQIILNNGNCFEPFYNLNEDSLYHFFTQLSKIELGLQYFDDFSGHYREIKEKNRNQSKQNKIDDVIEILKEDSINYETTIKDLERLRNTLDNRHFTKRQLFQHLLYWVALLLNDLKQGRAVASVTNKIIEEYFGDVNVRFSREENIKNYEPFTYYYTDAKGIILYHF